MVHVLPVAPLSMLPYIYIALRLLSELHRPLYVAFVDIKLIQLTEMQLLSDGKLYAPSMTFF